MSSRSIIVGFIVITFLGIFVVAMSVGYGNNNYLFQDGSKPLNANWDVGAYDISNIDSLEANDLDTGQGANELFDMDQNVLTTSDVTFNDLDIVGTAFLPQYGSDYGTVLYLPFEEGTGLTVFDQSPYGNDGTLGADPSTPTWTTGKFGKALSLDGENDYILIPDSASLDVTTEEITLKAYIYPTENAPHHSRIISKEIGVSTNSYCLVRKAGNTISFYVGTGKFLEGSIIVPNNQWSLIIATYIKATGDIRIYINGVLDVSGIVEDGLAVTAYNVHIGTNPGNSRPFEGHIDEVGIYNRALTSEEVRTHFLNMRGQYSRSVTVSDNYRILGTDLGVDFSIEDGDVNVHHNYVLEMDFTHLIHFTMGVGVTDVTVNVVPSEFWIKDKHFHKIGFSVDVAPGVGKSCSCSITDGTNTITVTLSEGETTGSSSTGAFDLDVSAETFTITYSQDAGGSSTKGMMVMLYHYKDNE